MRIIDRAYRFSGALAAFFLVMVGVLTLFQITGRLLNIQVRDAGIFAGYSMAASSFLALAYTLRTGGHIRVSVVITRVRGRARRIIEGWCLLVATITVGLFAWFSIELVYQSYKFGDMSLGMIAIPLWIPQLGMLVGVLLLEVAFLEELIRFLRGQTPTYDDADVNAHTE